MDMVQWNWLTPFTALATSKPLRSPAEIEDIILRKIFYVTLTEPCTTGAAPPDPRIVYLELTAAEILSEGRDLLLSRDLMERVLIFSAAEPPFPLRIRRVEENPVDEGQESQIGDGDCDERSQ
ncbi:hypothetical protein F2Q69_00018845 [Brassica cretica]|uniref:Uncharacterized protein n=1 Tax=Brassica cretica TaxID=69181 RepID=A0A8S9QDN4_BRACR|nr:hypothetical protein F2Q69_00018845 [Brassica cretica]